MNKTKIFDVLVVYTNVIASSASSEKSIRSPFQLNKMRAHYDKAYAYFLETCALNNLKAAFVTSQDIIGGGTAKCYWLYKDNKWVKVNKQCFSKLIFDKLSPIGGLQKERLKLLFSDPKVKPFNSPELFSLFFDKQKTYNTLQDFTIPTASISDKSRNGVDQALNIIKQITDSHPNANDFSDKVIVKDRFGSGGNNVYLVNSTDPRKEILDIVQKNKNISFILQPFAQFKTGYKYKNNPGFVDIRMIYLGQKVIQVYLRMAKKEDFRCNEHQGGELHYIAIKEVPLKVRKFAQQVARTLNTKNELYALDLVVSNSGNVFLMEGNIRPGLDWNLSLKKNERMAKKLIRTIVEELVKRVTLPTSAYHADPVLFPHELVNSSI